MCLRYRAAASTAAIILAAGISGCQMASDLEDRLDKISNDLAGTGETASAAAETDLPPVAVQTPETEEIPPETEAPPVHVSLFDSDKELNELFDPFVFAVSFTCYGLFEPPSMTDPMAVWEAVGWYAGYQFMVDAVGSYTDEDIREIQYCLTGGGSYIECPDDFIEGEWITHEDGVWRFGKFIENMVDYFGGYGTFNYQPRFSGYITSGTIFEESDGETYSWETFIAFAETNGIPKYVVDKIKISDSNGIVGGNGSDGGKIYEPGSEVSEDDLMIMISQNDLAFLLKNGLIMKESYQYYYNNEKTYESVTYNYYTGDDGAFCTLSSSLNNSSSGYYHGFNFWYDESRGRIECLAADNVDSSATDDLYGKNYSRLLLEYEKYVITDEDDETITIEGSSRTDDYINKRTFVMDKGTFRMYSSHLFITRINDDGTEDSIREEYTFEYSESFDIPSELKSLQEAFKGKTRKVTVVDVNGMLNSGTVTYEIPVGWELVPPDEENTYMDEEITKKYAYPGDENDYSLYVSFAEG